LERGLFLGCHLTEKFKTLPISNNSFEHIIGEDFLYVDKTALVGDLISSGPKVWFLTRPRRFGKTLLISTLNAIFTGQKELFQGLAVEERIDSVRFNPRPVIRMDFSRLSSHLGSAELELSLRRMTASVAKNLGLKSNVKIPANEMFRDLIEELASTEGSLVSILIDEYDSPLLAYLGKGEDSLKARAITSAYLSQLKSANHYISFAFICGVSKLTRLGLATALNDITDISLDPAYATICGFTHEELLASFSDRIEATAKFMNMSEAELLEKIREHYNGFRFDGVTPVYNPFSTLKFFQDKRFDNFWHKSGASVFVAPTLANRGFTLERFSGLQVDACFASDPGEKGRTTAEGALYQSGYLTITTGPGEDSFFLDFPNFETQQSLERLLKVADRTARKGILPSKDRLLDALNLLNPENAVKEFNRLYSLLPRPDELAATSDGKDRVKPEDDYPEALYLASLVAFLRGVGVLVEAVPLVRPFGAELIVKCDDGVWVMASKTAHDGDDEIIAEAALSQILGKGYGNIYAKSSLLGMALNVAKKGIVAWRFMGSAPSETSPKPADFAGEKKD
jgi:hypothetical protein